MHAHESSRTEPPESDWRERLKRLTSSHSGERERSAGADPNPAGPLVSFTPLALQFELRELLPRTADRWNGPVSRAVKPGEIGGGGELRLGVRPVQRTSRGWSRGGLTWSNIAHQGGRVALDPAQQLWFRQLHALARAATAIVVGQDPQWVMLDDFASPALWALLEDAEDLGIALVAARTHTAVRLLAEARVGWEAATAGDDGLRLTPTLRFDGETVEIGGGTAVIADHGVYAVETAGGFAVRLAPTGRRLNEAEIALISAHRPPAPILVPADEQPEFLAEGLPALRAGFQVTSRDASVQLPEPVMATTVLTAAWRSGHRLTLSWSQVGPGGASGSELRRALAAILLEAAPDGEVIPQVWTESGSGLPDPVDLRDAEAAEFLHSVLPRIAELPGVEVRRTGRAPEYRPVTASPSLEVTTVPSGQGDWFDLGVLVTVGGQTVPFAPLFRALSKGRKKLLLIDHTYLRLDHPALAPLAELIAEGQDLDEWETGLRITRHQAAGMDIWGEDDDLDAAEDSPERRRWRDLVRDVGLDAPEPVAMPAGITTELRPYQREGFHWLAFLWRHRLGGILADDMGLGKTLQCLTMMVWAREREHDPERRPFLVVAPTSVLGTWAAEAARFAPGLRVSVRTATEASSARSVDTDADEADLIITSYALFRLDAERYHAVARDPARGLAGLILDEAQSVKNPRSRGHAEAEALPVSWKLAVTGTPLENSLRELHAICHIVAPGLLPPARQFDTSVVRVLERSTPGVTAGPGAGNAPEVSQEARAEVLLRLRRRLRPFLLRRTKDRVAAELPAKQEQVLEVELSPEHRQLYDAFLQRERQKLYGLIADLDRHRFTVFRSLTLLRMLALDASLIDAQYDAIVSAKLEALVDITESLAREGRRALVFSQFTSFLDRARERLHAAGVRTVTLDGSTRNRDAVIERFRAGEADVFLISLKAGGVGLTLVEADTVLLLDPWWNPASEAQAIDRTHRIGQQQPVQVVRMIAVGTIEEKVLALQNRKRALFDSVIDDADHFSGAVTASDLRELLE